jgi:hypothetical protein
MSAGGLKEERKLSSLVKNAGWVELKFQNSENSIY